MFSHTATNVTQAQLRKSSARLSGRTMHLGKIIGAAAIALLASANTFANAAENPARMAREQHTCAVVLGLDPSERGYESCIESLDRSLSEWNYARAISTACDTCARRGFQRNTPAFAVCAIQAEQSQ